MSVNKNRKKVIIGFALISIVGLTLFLSIQKQHSFPPTPQLATEQHSTQEEPDDVEDSADVEVDSQSAEVDDFEYPTLNSEDLAVADNSTDPTSAPEELSDITISPTSIPIDPEIPVPSTSHGDSELLSVTLLDRILEPIKKGNIVFNAPQGMEIDEPEIIDLLLSPTKSIEELQTELESKGEIESATIEITNNMEAKLSGKNFTIEALRPERQAVTSRRTTKWRWEVAPTKSGKQKLRLTLMIYIIPNNRDTPYVLETFERNIEVKVPAKTYASNFLKSIWDFVLDNWEWAWTVIVAPVGLWIWRQRNRRRLSQRTPNRKRSTRRTPTRRN